MTSHLAFLLIKFMYDRQAEGSTPFSRKTFVRQIIVGQSTEAYNFVDEILSRKNVCRPNGF
jgi:hypothetical protein